MLWASFYFCTIRFSSHSLLFTKMNSTTLIVPIHFNIFQHQQSHNISLNLSFLEYRCRSRLTIIYFCVSPPNYDLMFSHTLHKLWSVNKNYKITWFYGVLVISALRKCCFIYFRLYFLYWQYFKGDNIWSICHSKAFLFKANTTQKLHLMITRTEQPWIGIRNKGKTYWRAQRSWPVLKYEPRPLRHSFFFFFLSLFSSSFLGKEHNLYRSGVPF